LPVIRVNAFDSAHRETTTESPMRVRAARTSSSVIIVPLFKLFNLRERLALATAGKMPALQNAGESTLP
jgi:hypothetical protein